MILYLNHSNRAGFIISILLFFTLEIGYSQTKYDVDTFSEDFKSIMKQPFQWDAQDFLKILTVSGITYATMHIDGKIREIVLDNSEYNSSIPVEFGRIWGEPLTSLLLGSSIYMHGVASNNYGNKKLGFEIGESAFYTAVITLLIKYSFGRERPRENSDPFSFHPFSFRNDNFLSLNSGHTALAFSLSTVLANNTSDKYLKIAFFVPAILTAFSRVYQNHHWTSDVVLGGFIGYVVAEFVTDLHKNGSSKNGRIVGAQEPINFINFTIPF